MGGGKKGEKEVEKKLGNRRMYVRMYGWMDRCKARLG